MAIRTPFSAVAMRTSKFLAKDLADINFLVWVVDLPGFKNLAGLWPGSDLELNPKHRNSPSQAKVRSTTQRLGNTAKPSLIFTEMQRHL